MRTQSGNNAAPNNFKDAAQRVALLSRVVDQLDHLLLRIVVSAVQRRVVRNGGNLVPIQLERPVGNAAELDHVTANFNSEYCQQLFGECATRDARRRLASRGAFENVAQI